jgi:hypothetical protein
LTQVLERSRDAASERVPHFSFDGRTVTLSVTVSTLCTACDRFRWPGASRTGSVGSGRRDEHEEPSAEARGKLSPGLRHEGERRPQVIHADGQLLADHAALDLGVSQARLGGPSVRERDAFDVPSSVPTQPPEVERLGAGHDLHASL